MQTLRRGLTLVEVSLSMALMVMLLGSVLSLLVSTRSLHLSYEHRVSRARDMASALNRLARDLSFTRYGLITAGGYRETVNDVRITHGSSPWLGFPAACGDDGVMHTDESGSAVNQRYIIYIFRDHKLLRQEFRDLDLTRRLSFEEVRTASRTAAGEAVLQGPLDGSFDMTGLSRGGYVEVSMGGKAVTASGLIDYQLPWNFLRVYQ